MNQSLGIHLLVVAEKGKTIPAIIHEEEDFLTMREALQESVRKYAVTLHEMYIDSEHMHVLLECNDEDSATEAVPMIVNMSCEVVRRVAGHSFKLQEGVHITLIPPWHIKVLESYVRDQKRLHTTMTVDQEIVEIFMNGQTSLDAPDTISMAEINKGVN